MKVWVVVTTWQGCLADCWVFKDELQARLKKAGLEQEEGASLGPNGENDLHLFEKEVDSHEANK